MYKLECPHCDEEIEVDSPMSDELVQCPHCKGWGVVGGTYIYEGGMNYWLVAAPEGDIPLPEAE